MNRVIAMVLLGAVTPAAAQAPEPAVIVTATRFPEDRLDAPIGMTVITARQIGESTARTLPELLSQEAGIVTRDNTGAVRPLVPRTFSSFSEAEEENGQSRIYLGIHWTFDKTEGIAQGRKVAQAVFAKAFTPTRGEKRR